MHRTRPFVFDGMHRCVSLIVSYIEKSKYGGMRMLQFISGRLISF